MAPRAKLRLAGEILITYCRVRWAMGREELPQLVGRLRVAPPAAAQFPRAKREQLAGAVMGVLSILPTDSRCLVRSLVYLSLLAKRGVASTLVIGARTEPDFKAHAWIECEGEPLLPSGDGEFAPLTVI
ncbi:MAG TPA: lasso peptide biosynthesis B2 protein [Solirubrobacterales bacterium]|nr:lasso peptide biosynthesis B2 protein [Solirubrobacterales bacterium]